MFSFWWIMSCGLPYISCYHGIARHIRGNSKPLRIEFYWLWFFEWCWYHGSSIHVEIYFMVEEFIPLNFKLICLLFQCNCVWCMCVWWAIMYFKVLECTSGIIILKQIILTCIYHKIFCYGVSGYCFAISVISH